MIVYTVDESGERDAAFLPVIEGTMKGPDAVFGLIKYYLKQLVVTRAKKILDMEPGIGIDKRSGNCLHPILFPRRFFSCR
jgi:hypothetical protein